jgi:diacylglycerol kinase (ATP)
MTNGRPERYVSARRGRLYSFLDAARGLRLLVATQPNARIHSVATALAVALGVWTGLNSAEWCALVLAITVVWVAEGLNTAVEFTVNLVSPERQQLAGWAKDVAAGAVLASAIGASIVGGILFLPKLLPLLGVG